MSTTCILPVLRKVSISCCVLCMGVHRCCHCVCTPRTRACSSSRSILERLTSWASRTAESLQALSSAPQIALPYECSDAGGALAAAASCKIERADVQDVPHMEALLRNCHGRAGQPPALKATACLKASMHPEGSLHDFSRIRPLDQLSQSPATSWKAKCYVQALSWVTQSGKMQRRVLLQGGAAGVCCSEARQPGRPRLRGGRPRPACIWSPCRPPGAPCQTPCGAALLLMRPCSPPMPWASMRLLPQEASSTPAASHPHKLSFTPASAACTRCCSQTPPLAARYLKGSTRRNTTASCRSLREGHDAWSRSGKGLQASVICTWRLKLRICAEEHMLCRHKTFPDFWSSLEHVLQPLWRAAGSQCPPKKRRWCAQALEGR